MTNRLIVSAAFAGGMAAALGPLLAQEDDGLRQRLRIDQTFGTGKNIGLEIPAEGRTSLSVTRLTYGLESETRYQKLAFALGGALRFGSVAQGNNIDTGFTDPLVGLRYSREAANALVSFSADYRQTDISLAAPLWTFLDDDGIVRPPRDFSDIQGSGKRRQYRLNATFETGREAPVGLVFTAAANGTRYVNPTDPTLTNYDNANIGVSTLFRFDAATTGFVDLRYATYENENILPTDRETQTVELGFDRDFSASSRLTARIGYTDVDTTQGGVRTKQSGPSGRLGYNRDLVNGNFDTTFTLTQNQDGQRGTLRFTRSVELPLGSLSANIGLTSFDSTSPRVIGGLNWQYTMPSSRLNLRLNRDVFVDANDEDRFTTAFLAGYTYEINAVSSISADLSLWDSEAGTTTNGVQRGDLVITYEYELTEDWNLNTGIDFRMRDEQTVGTAKSTAVFFGIGRNFDLSN